MQQGDCHDFSEDEEKAPAIMNVKTTEMTESAPETEK
jgi:hypothetical protein